MPERTDRKEEASAGIGSFLFFVLFFQAMAFVMA